jgi:hypothetical protein
MDWKLSYIGCRELEVTIILPHAVIGRSLTQSYIHTDEDNEARKVECIV